MGAMLLFALLIFVCVLIAELAAMGFMVLYLIVGTAMALKQRKRR